MIYTWECQTCGNLVEVERKRADIDVPPTEDESEDHLNGCSGPDWVRIISKTSFSLKGGGWADQGYSRRGR